MIDTRTLKADSILGLILVIVEVLHAAFLERRLTLYAAVGNNEQHQHENGERQPSLVMDEPVLHGAAV